MDTMFDLFNSPQSPNNEDGDDTLKRFERHGGRMTKRDLDRYVNQIPFQDYEREYVKAVMAKFDNPHEPSNQRYITQEEFLSGLDEMAQNNRDSITPDEVERIKKYFSA